MMLLTIVHSNYVPGFTTNISVEPARFRVYKLFFFVSLTTKLLVRLLIQLDTFLEVGSVRFSMSMNVLRHQEKLFAEKNQLKFI